MSEMSLVTSTSSSTTPKDDITAMDVITPISADDQGFIASKSILRVHSLFFETLFECTDSNMDEFPMAESTNDIELFLDAIEGRPKMGYSLGEATSLMVMEDKSCLVTHPIEMFCLAVQTEDTQLAELAAKSCLHLNFMDQTDWTVSALTKSNDLDRDLSQKLILYHQAHESAAKKAVSRVLYRSGIIRKNWTYTHESGRFDSPTITLKIGKILSIFQAADDLEEILNESLKSDGCNSCDHLKEDLKDRLIEAWKDELSKIPLPFSCSELL